MLGSGVTALGVIRILSRAGVPAFASDGADLLIRNSRWYRPLPGDTPDPSREPLASWLQRLPLDRAVLMPCSDDWVRDVASLDPALRSRFPASVSSLDTVQRFVDKGRFAETLRSTGTPHPFSKIVDEEDQLADVPDQVFESAILKPRDSQAFMRRYGFKAYHVSSRDEAATTLRRLIAEGHPVILQEYIPGPPTNHFFVDGFVDRAGTVRASFVRQRLRMHPPDFGNSTYMVSVRPEMAAQAVDSITALLRSVAHRGIFSAEFKRDDRDGRFKLLEVNIRPWWYVDFAARCGVDVCLMAYADALEHEVPTLERYKIGRTAVFPYSDYFACVALREAKQLSLGQWAKSWLTSTQPVFQPSDPLPGLIATSRILTAFVRNRLQRASSRR